MRTIIAGSRNVTDYNEVLDAVIDSGFIITEIVSGTARGVDSIGESIGEEFNIPVVRFPAEWDRYGRHQAGRIRNKQMAEYAEALVAVWDGVSSGTKNMIDIATKLGLKVHIGIVECK